MESGESTHSICVGHDIIQVLRGILLTRRVCALLCELRKFVQDQGEATLERFRFPDARRAGVIPLRVDNVPVEDVDLKGRIRAVKRSAVRVTFTLVQLIASITRLISTAGKLEKCQFLSE